MELTTHKVSPTFEAGNIFFCFVLEQLMKCGVCHFFLFCFFVGALDTFININCCHCHCWIYSTQHCRQFVLGDNLVVTNFWGKFDLD